MGCDGSKQNATKKEVVYIAGYPSAGKTFMGDYLATRGWAHIDGDMGNQSKDPVVMEKFHKLWAAMQAAQKGEPVAKELWQPYFDHLIACVREELKTKDKAVLSFAIMGLFEGEQQHLRNAFP